MSNEWDTFKNKVTWQFYGNLTSNVIIGDILLTTLLLKTLNLFLRKFIILHINQGNIKKCDMWQNYRRQPISDIATSRCFLWQIRLAIKMYDRRHDYDFSWVFPTLKGDINIGHILLATFYKRHSYFKVFSEKIHN